MARDLLSLQDILYSGKDIAYSQVTNGDGYVVDNATHKTFLHVKNNSGGSVNVTIITPGTIDGMAKPDRIVAIPDNEERLLGSFPHGLHCQKDTLLDPDNVDHAVYVDYSVTHTQITQAAVKLLPAYIQKRLYWVIGESKIGQAKVG